MSASFATEASALSASLLTDYLKKAGLLDSGEVAAADWEIIGTGKMGDNARFTLRYSEEVGESPQTLIAKFPAADEHARAMAGAHGAYYNEVMFYRELAGGTQMRTPAIYGSELSDDHTAFLLLMEDMSPAQPGSNLEGATRADTELVLDEVAKLASDYYGDETLSGRDYVVSSGEDGGEFGQSLMQQSWPGFLERFGSGLSEECIAFGDRFVDRVTRFVASYDGPRTLIHGDLRSENILFLAGSATTVDWQTVSESSPLTDAAYFLGGSVDIQDRRAWERPLVERYQEQLAARGVLLTEQSCWEQYRLFAMHGLMITVLGAMFSSADERSDAMFLKMIQRHLQHCVDVNAGEFLD